MNINNKSTGAFAVPVIVLFFASLLSSSCSLFTSRADEAMVRVYSDTAVGQGVIVDASGYVVTDSNYLKDSQPIYVELRSGTRYEGKILCVDTSKNITILKMQGDFGVLKPLPMSDSDLVRQYDEVSIAYYPAGSKSIKVLKGKILSLPQSGGINYLQTTASIDAEILGGAVMNKADELIGVMSWNPKQPEHEGYALISNEIASTVYDAQQVEAAPLSVVSIEVPRVTNKTAILSWRTNRPSTGLVEYGLQAGIYAFKTNEDDELLDVHSFVIENLQPDLTYHFRTKSVDCCGNIAYSQDNSFTTSGTVPAGKLAIVSPRVLGISSSGASVRWITNKPASSTVFYLMEKGGKKQSVTDASLVYEHEVRIEGLTPETRYSISIQSDVNGETAQADAGVITTPSTAPVCCKVFCRIPEFEFQTMQESRFSYADLAGRKTVIVFSKTGCSYCMQQALFLNEYYMGNPNAARMMIVFSNEKMSDVTEWARKYGITVPVYLDVTGGLVNQCKLRTIPSWLIVDEGTIIKYYHSGGYGSKQEMERAITDNLK